MALIEEFDKQGNFLFRWRTYVPGVILIISIFFLPEVAYFGGNYETNLYYTLICLVVSFLGQGIRAWTIGHTPANTSGRNTKEQVADLVNQTGIYSTVRHPLYLGNFFMYLGVVLLLKSFLFTMVFILFFFLYYERIMYAEEFFLRSKFGKDYLQWADKTPAFFPDFSLYQKPSLPLSLRNVLKREYPGIFGIIFIFGCFDIAILYFNEPGRFLTGFWEGLRLEQVVFLSFGFLFYIGTRILVKTTRILHVEGR
jgi:lipid A Kdo2 1-phosphate O-methyltransferase